MAFDYKQSNEDRLRRANSWYQQGIKEEISDEESFLFLWIAFEAAYNSLGNKDENEKDRVHKFINEVIRLDKSNQMEVLLRSTGPLLRKLLENEYIYRFFWYAKRKNRNNNWKKDFDRENEAILKHWLKDIPTLLCTILERLYILRNQMLHGGMTFGGDSFGKRQIRDSRPVMGKLVKFVIDIMEDDISANPRTTRWGKVAFLRFNDEPDQ